MVVKPLVGQHAPEQNETERGVGLDHLPICSEVRLAQKFSAEANLFLLPRRETDRSEEYWQPDDIPEGKEDG